MLKAYAQRSIRRRGLEVVLFDGPDRVLLPVAFCTHTYEPGLEVQPTFTLPEETAHELFQQMWDAGYRPNNGSGSGAEAEALKNHIKFAERMADRLLLANTPPRIVDCASLQNDPRELKF